MKAQGIFRGQSPLRWLLGLMFGIIFLCGVAVPASIVSDFYYHLNELDYYVSNQDEVAGLVELDEITSFYDHSRQWGMQWFADSYLFGDSFLYQAAFAYLVGDYETVVEDLQSRPDDHRASHLLGVTKFKMAQIRYRAIEGENQSANQDRDEIVVEVLEEINPDFERALRSDPGGRFDYKWNYDLTSDPEAVRRALEIAEPPSMPELEQMEGEGVPARQRRG